VALRTAANRAAAVSGWAVIWSLMSASRGGVGAVDQFAEHRHERGVLAGQLARLGAGGVDQANRVVGEVRRLDDPGWRAGLQAGADMFLVLLVCVPVRLLRRVGDRRDEIGHATPELPGQRGDGFRLPSARRQLAWVVLDRVVQQGGAGQVGIGGPVVADDPDRHPQHVIHIWLALAPVGRMQPGRQRERLLCPVPVGGRPPSQPRDNRLQGVLSRS